MVGRVSVDNEQSAFKGGAEMTLQECARGIYLVANDNRCSERTKIEFIKAEILELFCHTAYKVFYNIGENHPIPYEVVKKGKKND